MRTSESGRKSTSPERPIDSEGNGARPAAGKAQGELLAYEELTLAAYGDWDSYVRAAPGGLPLHLAGWRDVLRSTYGYETHYLLAYHGDRIAGVLPLFIVPSLLTGRRAMTMPGGFCADDELIAAGLIEQAQIRTTALGIKQLIIQDARSRWVNAGRTISRHVHWLVNLGSSEAALWQQLDGNIRRQVRKAQKNGLVAEVDRSGKLLNPFYDVFSRFTHQAGTPVFSRSFLANIVETFPGEFNIAVIWRDGEPIAGYFQLELNDTVYGMWGAALFDYRDLRPAYLAIWEIMGDAIGRGFHFLDMGRSPSGTTASKFKSQWGGLAQAVYQQVICAGNVNPDTNLTEKVQTDGKYQLFMQLWRFLPYSITRRLGPKLRWHIPFA